LVVVPDLFLSSLPLAESWSIRVAYRKNMGAQDFGCVQCAQVIRQTDAAHTSVDPSKKGEEKKMMMMRRRSCSRK
jgi:hypothetical protein